MFYKSYYMLLHWLKQSLAASKVSYALGNEELLYALRLVQGNFRAVTIQTINFILFHHQPGGSWRSLLQWLTWSIQLLVMISSSRRFWVSRAEASAFSLHQKILMSGQVWESSLWGIASRFITPALVTSAFYFLWRKGRHFSIEVNVVLLTETIIKLLSTWLLSDAGIGTF